MPPGVCVDLDAEQRQVLPFARHEAAEAGLARGRHARGAGSR